MAGLKVFRRSEGFCALGIGDCGTKSKTETNIDLKTINSTVNEFISSKSNKVTASGINLNDMELVIGRTSGHCNINASQKITSTQTTTGELSPTDMKDLRNKIKESVDASIDQQAKAKSGMFQTAPATSENISNYKKTVENKINNKITDTQLQEISNSVFNKNTKKVTLGECTDDSKLDFSQDVVSQLVTQGVMKGVSQAVAGAETEVAQKLGVKSSAESHGGGLEDVIGAIFAGLTGIWGIVAIVFICICLAVLAFALSPAGQKATTNASGAGANIAKAKYGH
jgi:hypothetical protein